MAESKNDRRERIAEAVFVMLAGHPTLPWSVKQCAQKAREWADEFLRDAPKQPTSRRAKETP